MNVGGEEAATAVELQIQGHNVARDFDEKIKKFDKTTKKRLRYYKRWIPIDREPGVLLCAACKATTNDGNYEFYKELLCDCYVPGKTVDQLERTGEEGKLNCSIADFAHAEGFTIFTRGADVTL